MRLSGFFVFVTAAFHAANNRCHQACPATAVAKLLT